MQAEAARGSILHSNGIIGAGGGGGGGGGVKSLQLHRDRRGDDSEPKVSCLVQPLSHHHWPINGPSFCCNEGRGNPISVSLVFNENDSTRHATRLL